jgi:hypothetical protein
MNLNALLARSRKSFELNTFDVWVKAAPVGTRGKVSAAAYTRETVDALGTIQHMTTRDKVSMGLDVSERLGTLFRAGDTEEIPTDAVIVDTINHRHWQVAGPGIPHYLEGFEGIVHWEYPLNEAVNPIKSIAEEYA